MLTKIKKLRKDSVLIRRDFEVLYANKYYNLFMNNYKFEGLDYRQIDFILRKMWSDGSVACFKVEGTEGSTEYPNGLLGFTEYAVSEWDIYSYPIYVNLVNPKGVKWIPSRRLLVDQEAVIGYVQRNKKGVYSMILPYIKRLALVEMTIYAHLNGHKLPWILKGQTEDKQLLEEIFDDLMSDKPVLYLTSEQTDKIDLLNVNTPFIIDKLHSYKAVLENEIREYLGLNNLGINEKKEHLITSEIEANTEVVEASKNSFIDVLREFIERINKTFNQDLKVELNQDNERLERAEVKENEEDETI